MGEYVMDWKYRFANFQWALTQLTNSLSENVSSGEVSKEVPVYFEVVSELALKSLNDYLTESGHIFQSPQEMLEVAFRENLIYDLVKWKKLLEKEPVSDDLNVLDNKIREGHRLFIGLHDKLNSKIPKM
ncbi:MAG: hypothetical protein GX640_06110 [Fibrobacter sp.]|nr:hypothetical protein [Fibrobacter sp.]